MSYFCLKTINELVIERGEKRGLYFRATLTSGEILERLGQPRTPPNHQNVKKTIDMNYSGTEIKSIGVNGSGGWTFYMKVRSK